MKPLAVFLPAATVLVLACTGEPRPAPPPAAESAIPGEPVLAVPGRHQAPPPPPDFAPKVGDAGADSAAVEGRER